MYLNLNTTEHTGPLPRKLLQFTQAIRHYAYNKKTSDNDIALLKLSEPLDINIYTPLCLPCKNDNFLGKKAWATGEYVIYFQIFATHRVLLHEG